MNKEIKKLKEENKNANERIYNLENIINTLKNDIIELKEINKSNYSKMELIKSMNSTIIEKEEFDMIHSEIKQRMNKKIKAIKKLYQATIDGIDPNIFHKKCDNIPNILVLYKTQGNRRFGGFASVCWTSKTGQMLDPNCFLFSLDKKKFIHHKKIIMKSIVLLILILALLLNVHMLSK